MLDASCYVGLSAKKPLTFFGSSFLPNRLYPHREFFLECAEYEEKLMVAPTHDDHAERSLSLTHQIVFSPHAMPIRHVGTDALAETPLPTAARPHGKGLPHKLPWSDGAAIISGRLVATAHTHERRACPEESNAVACTHTRPASRRHVRRSPSMHSTRTWTWCATRPTCPHEARCNAAPFADSSAASRHPLLHTHTARARASHATRVALRPACRRPGLGSTLTLTRGQGPRADASRRRGLATRGRDPPTRYPPSW